MTEHESKKTTCLQDFIRTLPLSAPDVAIIGDNATTHNLVVQNRANGDEYQNSNICEEGCSSCVPCESTATLVIHQEGSRSTENIGISKLVLRSSPRLDRLSEKNVSRWEGSLSTSTDRNGTGRGPDDPLTLGSFQTNLENPKSSEQSSQRRDGTIRSSLPMRCPKRRDSVDEAAEPTVTRKQGPTLSSSNRIEKGTESKKPIAPLVSSAMTTTTPTIATLSSSSSLSASSLPPYQIAQLPKPATTHQKELLEAMQSCVTRP